MMISFVPLSIFAIVFAILMRLLNPVLVKYLDPHTLQLTDRLIESPESLPRQLRSLLRHLVPPAIHAVVLILGLWLCAPLIFRVPSDPFSPEQIAKHLTITDKASLAMLFQAKHGDVPFDTTEIQAYVDTVKDLPKHAQDQIWLPSVEALTRQGVFDKIDVSVDKGTGDIRHRYKITPIGEKVIQILENNGDKK